ncbi:hypothetical protein D0C16_22385 [Cellvibrio sp. KY-GH-1]|uniref:hypothetical protein n=1 Tax=Cellvibrio sp. KY-GH-1 TaxID=2303332 RepID=UPI0012440B36|nr:hypothetical protein [Cellvibrio sp. KY-GH-1]QEY18482.1 hypothetical protein D0C16_22385 [Cellvibrio sp. KY-GH-1]
MSDIRGGDQFDTGVVRIASRSFAQEGKYYFGDEGFAMPYSEWQRIKTEANGDYAIISKRLGFVTTIDPEKMVILKFNRSDVSSLRIPTGNEIPDNPSYGANQLWVPGIKTINGVTEALFKVPSNVKPTEIPF